MHQQKPVKIDLNVDNSGRLLIKSPKNPYKTRLSAENDRPLSKSWAAICFLPGH